MQWRKKRNMEERDRKARGMECGEEKCKNGKEWTKIRGMEEKRKKIGMECGEEECNNGMQRTKRRGMECNEEEERRRRME